MALFENELQCYIFAVYHTILIPHEIKNLLFDLGGVIINLDVSRTYQAFATLADSSEFYAASRCKFWEGVHRARESRKA